MSENKSFQRCTRCIFDTTVSDIVFDSKGECQYCKIHDEMERLHPLGDLGEERLKNSIEKIKKKGRGEKYDCVVGTSGGRDSTYTLYIAVKLGLRPLAVHFDNGWNTDISVRNVKNACKILDIDLYTVVADWEEFKDLQISFLKTSTPDADIPSDYAIVSTLYKVASKEGIKYILNGHSFRTEGTTPISWMYMDGRYFKSVCKKFGVNKKIKSFPILTATSLFYYSIIKRIRYFFILENIEYIQKDIDKVIKKELEWEYYGGHHHENTYTKFFQSYYLPKKFNIDKRKREYSALIRSDQFSREKALEIIEKDNYEYDEDVVKYVINKLGLSQNQWKEIMESPIKSHEDYPTYLKLIKLFRFPIKIAVKLKLLPNILYLKYAQ